MEGRLLNRITRGMTIALRTGAAPLFVGARLASRWGEQLATDLPTPQRGLALASKIALDE